MAEKKYRCLYCEKEYNSIKDRDKCIDLHDLIYVPMPKGDLNRILNFLMSKNEEYLSESLVKNLFRWVRHE